MALADRSELEAALLEIPSVEDCAVRVRTNSAGGQERVAYVLSSEKFVTEKVHARLASVLQPSDLPSAYVPVTHLPLTPEGELRIPFVGRES